MTCDTFFQALCPRQNGTVPDVSETVVCANPRPLSEQHWGQWSDRAILRTTPALLGLYSLITVWATALFDAGAGPRGASWYAKTHLTFSDAIAAVRYRLWLPDEFFTSTARLSVGKIPVDLAQRMADALCYAA